jgi:purine-binding chemotaxis protein CheW
MKSIPLVVFPLDEQRYALHLSAVERVLRAAEVTQLPRAPGIVRGVVNMRGRVIPVLDIRKRFRLPDHEVDLDDRLILARTSRRRVVLSADAVSGIIERLEEDVIGAEDVLPGLEYVQGVPKLAVQDLFPSPR